jgi:hypothetical protein
VAGIVKPTSFSAWNSARLHTEEGWPSQIGVPITRMSAARILRRSSGQASPGPSSEVTPGFTS